MGIWIALLLVIAWALSFLGVCSIDLAHHSVWWIAGLLLVRTFLQTGLFITAHDAMHGSIYVNRPHWNRWIGSACTLLYALLPYDTLLIKHHLHHQYPATKKDPDFSDRGMLGWYLKFMGGYIDRRQSMKLLLGMGGVFMIAHYLLGVAVWNLLLLWVLPILLSSWQLFYFGTYLPHRSHSVDYAKSISLPATVSELSGSEKKPDAAIFAEIHSSNLHPFWSLLTCYHFGYHWEHHEYPQTPWYLLPEMKKM